MCFLEECRKSEEEGKAGQAKAAAATVPTTRQDELTKQLKYQQYQIDALVGQVKNLVSVVRATQPPPVWLGQETLLMGEGILGGRSKAHGEGALREGACPLKLCQDPLPCQQSEVPSKSRKLQRHTNLISAGNVERWGI